MKLCLNSCFKTFVLSVSSRNSELLHAEYGNSLSILQSDFGNLTLEDVGLNSGALTFKV